MTQLPTQCTECAALVDSLLPGTDVCADCWPWLHGPRHLYRCYMQTNAGMFTQYDGHVDVRSPVCSEPVLFDLAFAELKRTPFPGHSLSMWRMTSQERID